MSLPVQIFFNLQNHHSFHSEERLDNLVTWRECFVGLSILLVFALKELSLTPCSDYGLNGRLNTSKLVLDDYMEFDHVQYIIQRGGSVVLVPYALKVSPIEDSLHTDCGMC